MGLTRSNIFFMATLPPWKQTNSTYTILAEKFFWLIFIFIPFFFVLLLLTYKHKNMSNEYGWQIILIQNVKDCVSDIKKWRNFTITRHFTIYLTNSLESDKQKNIPVAKFWDRHILKKLGGNKLCPLGSHNCSFIWNNPWSTI